MYEYTATILRVVDGDTLDLRVDLGFRICTEIRVRLAGIDTPEVYGVKKGSEEYATGAAASQFAKDWIEANCPDNRCRIRSLKVTGKYNRWIVDVLPLEEGADSLNESLVKEGHAERVEY